MLKHLAMLMFLSSNALAEGRVGTGGDKFAGPFTQRGYKILKLIEAGYANLLGGEKFFKLGKAIEAVPVRSTEGILYDLITGKEVDAIVVTQDGRNMILLSRARLKLEDILSGKSDLVVLHEYLRAADIDDENYIVSKQVDLLPIKEPEKLKPYISSEATYRLEFWVQRNLEKLSLASASYGPSDMILDEQSVTCQATYGWNIPNHPQPPAVGQCIIVGRKENPHTLINYSVIVFERKPGDPLYPDLGFDMQVLTGYEGNVKPY